MCALALGIDLGTTNSCVAIYRNEKVKIIQNEEGLYVIPSWVGFTDNGILTGYEAKNEAHKYIKNSVYEAKRLVGQRYKDEKVKADIKRFPFQVINDVGSPKIKVEYQDKTEEYYPEEISAFVLLKLKDLAEAYLGQKVNRVVVTVPAYFNDLQRQATKDAAVIAGFQTVNVINEPTAAALAYSYHSKKPYKRNVMVYDFGGGTFDVSIVTVGRGKCEVKATKGDSHLGGTDIDTNLVNFIKEDFEKQFGEKLTKDEALTRRIRTRCEKIKEKLSGASPAVEIELDDMSGRNYTTTISKSEFERLNMSIFERTLKIVQDCLKDADLSKDQIDEIVLVGGSSRIPKVQQMLKKYFGEDKVNKGINPDEAVAYGAAIHAANLLGQKCEIKDIISLSLGIAVLGKDKKGPLSSVLIPCNTPIPAQFTKCYYTNRDDQTSALISVHQGESPLAEENFELGNFKLMGISKGPAGTVQVDVCFSVDAEGILSVAATEVGAENVNSIQVDVKKKGLTPNQIKNRITEIEKHRQDDKARKEFNNEKYYLEIFCDQAVEKSYKIKDDGFKDALFNKCNDIRKWLQKISVKDWDELKQRKMELEDLYDVSENN